jgi:hypothetical protein
MLKLNLSSSVREEWLQFVENVTNEFLRLEEMPSDEGARFWVIEPTGLIQQKCKRVGHISTAPQELYPVEVATWQYFEKTFDWFLPFLEKYKLQHYLPTVMDNEVTPHRHATWEDGIYASWTIPIFFNDGILNLVTPKKPFDIEPSIDPCNMFQCLSEEDQYSTDKSFIIRSGDIYLFDGWGWHEFYCSRPARTFAFSPKGIRTAEQAMSYKHFIESM